MDKRTGPRKKALQIIKYFRHENPDYNYLRTVFQHLRKELNVAVTAESKKLPYVPTETELKKYYEVVWQTKNMQDMIIIKTLLYTGIRVSELIQTLKILTMKRLKTSQCNVLNLHFGTRSLVLGLLPQQWMSLDSINNKEPVNPSVENFEFNESPKKESYKSEVCSIQ